MKLHAAATLCLLAPSAIASAQDRVGPPAPPAPSVAGSIPRIPEPVQQFEELVPGEVRCGGARVAPTWIEPSFATIIYSPYGGTHTSSFAMQFDIDASGRTRSIKLEQQNEKTVVSRSSGGIGDVGPSLAAWRFPSGAPQRGCRVDFIRRTAPVADASGAVIMRYLASPHTRASNEDVIRKRIYPEGSNCFEGGAPVVRMRAYPDFDAIPQNAGSRSFTMTAFDIDAKGKATNVRVIGSGGNAVLDRESVAAVKQSRFGSGDPRTGCIYPYFRRGEKLPAPDVPDKAVFKPADAQCPDGDTKWTYMPPLAFPSSFRSSGIEGWAVIGYDVAPWGQTGNVRVLAAEPSSAFGEAARAIVMSARQAESHVGRGGCVDLVRFVLPARKGPVSEGAAD